MGLEDDFKHEGYEVETASTGLDGLQKALTGSFEAIILDVMLPEMNGFDVCKKLRQKDIKTPVLFLTAKGEEIDKVLGLELGADDYLTKPFSPRELQARIKALIRRYHKPEESGSTEMLLLGDIEIDFEKYQVTRSGEAIKLTSQEFMLLKFMAENRNKVVNRQQIIDGAWTEDVVVSNRTVDTHIANLRMKLEDDPKDPKFIKSFRGIGYTLIC